MSKLTSMLCGATLVAGLWGSAAAETINIDTFLTGDSAYPDALVATLELNQSNGDVNFTLNNFANTVDPDDDAFISGLWFSFDGTPAITAGNFTNFTGQTVDQIDINPGLETNAGYDFYLDFGFPVSAQDDRFLDGEFASWTITGVTVADFLQAAEGNNGILALVHLQGLGADDEDSAKYGGNGGGNGVPEPGTLALLSLGLLAAGWRHRKSV